MKDMSLPTQPVIEARNLQLVFPTDDGPVQALKDVNLALSAWKEASAPRAVERSGIPVTGGEVLLGASRDTAKTIPRATLWAGEGLRLNGLQIKAIPVKAVISVFIRNGVAAQAARRPGMQGADRVQQCCRQGLFKLRVKHLHRLAAWLEHRGLHDLSLRHDGGLPMGCKFHSADGSQQRSDRPVKVLLRSGRSKMWPQAQQAFAKAGSHRKDDR